MKQRLKGSIMLRSQIDLQRWKIWTLRLKLILSGKQLERISEFLSAKESLGYYEMKKHKQWFDERCSKLLDQRKQAKLQW
jgi:hypothetical protein